FRGNTAREVIGGCLMPLAPPRFSSKPMVSSANAAVTAKTTFRRAEAVLFSGGKRVGPEVNCACDGSGCTCGLESRSLQVTEAAKRYPLPTTVSMKRGFSE